MRQLSGPRPAGGPILRINDGREVMSWALVIHILIVSEGSEFATGLVRARLREN